MSRCSLPLPHLGDWTHDGQPVVARARRDALEGGRQVAVGGLVAQLGHAGPAGHGVVDHDGRPLGVDLAGGRHAADVPAVADREQRQHPDGGVLDGVQRARQRGAVEPAASTTSGSTTYQMARVTSVEVGRSSGSLSHQRAREGVLALVADDGGVHLGRPEVQPAPAHRTLGVDLEQADLRVAARHRVGGAVVGLDAGHAGVEVERRRTRQCWPWCRYEAPACTCSGARARSTSPTGRSPSAVTIRTGAPDALRSPTPWDGHPRPTHTAIGSWRRPRWRTASSSACTSRRTPSSSTPGHQRWSAWVSGSSWAAQRRCGSSTKGLAGFTTAGSGARVSSSSGWRGQPLVELVAARHEHGRRRRARPPGPTGLLPERGDRAGEAVDHHRVEAADVDAELERRRGHDAGQLPGEQLVLDGAALLGEVAAAVGPHPPRASGAAGAARRRRRSPPPAGCGRSRAWCARRR